MLFHKLSLDLFLSYEILPLFSGKPLEDCLAKQSNTLHTTLPPKVLLLMLFGHILEHFETKDFWGQEALSRKVGELGLSCFSNRECRKESYKYVKRVLRDINHATRFRWVEIINLAYEHIEIKR